MNRREFLAASAVCAACPPFVSLAQDASQHVAKPMLCVFSKHLQFLKDYDEMATAAADAGFDGVDLTVRPDGHVLPENVERDLPRAAKAVAKAGLEIGMITTALDDPEQAVSEATVRTAAEHGIRYYRMGYLKYDESLGVAGSLEALKPRMAGLAKLNGKYKVHGAYQNHAGTRVGGPVWDLWLLLKNLDPQWMGCQYDVRHATVEGGTCWPLGLKLLAPWIKITALKDFHWVKNNGNWSPQSVPLGEGMVDFKTYFRLVKEFSVEGPISMHFEYDMTSQPAKPMSKEKLRTETVAAMKKDVAILRRWLKDRQMS